MKSAPLSTLNKNGELPDHTLNGITQIHQRLNKWKCLEELSITEEYLQGRLGIVVELDDKVRTNTSNHMCPPIWAHAKRAIVHPHDGFPVWLADFNIVNAG